MTSIILPTYNEAENIQPLINELFKHVEGPLEVIVVDDDSPDGTWKIARELNNPGVKVIRREGERGLATAIDRGLREANGDVVGWMDADMCMPPALLPEMLKNLGEHDVVIGSRYAKAGGDDRGFLRITTSRAINWFAGLLLGFYVKDYDSGFIVLKREVLEKVAFPAGGHGDYFIELMFRCGRAGLRIKEVPYTFKDRERGESKTAASLSEFIKLGFRYLARIVKLRFGG